MVILGRLKPFLLPIYEGFLIIFSKILLEKVYEKLRSFAISKSKILRIIPDSTCHHPEFPHRAWATLLGHIEPFGPGDGELFEEVLSQANLKQGTQIHQPTVWPAPHVCAQPYHPGSSSHGQLILSSWGLSAWHSRRVNERGKCHADEPQEGRNSCPWLPLPG